MSFPTKSQNFTIPTKGRVMSPLRYPGSKRRQADYVARFLTHNNLKPRVLVEPFAGGASVALRLLAGGYVDEIALGEADSNIASFWKAAFFHTDKLVDKIESTPATLDEWKRQHSLQPTTLVDRAFKAFFLNRTSYSGIIGPHAGPIGGQAQESEYTIDCRYPIDRLVKRIRQVEELAENVLFVHNGLWQETIREIQNHRIPRHEVFFYFDPPFYGQGPRLYPLSFSHKQHTNLRDALHNLKSPWLLSYDDHENVKELYRENGWHLHRVALHYTAGRLTSFQTARSSTNELVYSNQPLPSGGVNG